jgi:ribosomal protein L40E
LAVVVLVGGLFYVLQPSVGSAMASERAGATVVVLAGVGAGDEFEYIGSKACRKCHIKNYKSWEEGPHAKSLDVLKPGNATEEKEKHNLDAATDYSTDEKCLKCHVVGFGKPGGYTVPDPADEKAVKKASELAAVGCESCHGPGGGLLDLKNEIMKEKRKYKFAELEAKGAVAPTAEQCTKCHTEDHPTYTPEKKFDFEKMKEKGVHEHVELKQREE